MQTKDFLTNFADPNGEAKYVKILQDVANRKIKAIQIELEDLINYKDLDEEFLRRVTENTRRYIGIFADAIDELLPEPTVSRGNKKVSDPKAHVFEEVSTILLRIVGWLSAVSCEKFNSSKLQICVDLDFTPIESYVGIDTRGSEGFSFLFHRKDNKSFFAAKFTLLLFITMPTTSKRFIQEAQVPYEVHSNMLLIDDQVHNVLGSSIGRKAVI
ncbi:DNA replication licensing factor mcm7 [Phtheirospermum japonicum]|uniref:DNA replication licensing factor mcm7 n=1 Tax=Phtheirospermum japonicum TaxID=374723 RepID=A0A830CCD3_9LAMI|nr:DNA replication licensing factor mcm7 [Phtheirospermum japonicum]